MLIALYDNDGLLGYTSKFASRRDALAYHQQHGFNGFYPTRAFKVN